LHGLLDNAIENGSNELGSIIGTTESKTPPWLRLMPVRCD
jgi:hypothetical protein